METIIKHDKEDNYIEIDLTKEEIDNLLKGRYPSNRVLLSDRTYVISVGVKEDGN